MDRTDAVVVFELTVAKSGIKRRHTFFYELQPNILQADFSRGMYVCLFCG
jgi:hypothetical protein